uniref:FGENESH: predicted gene_6.26 protein n=1 Tax=Rhodotorula toruloides TaxID=5286 RepID=A0A0K3CE77_RHOTO
MRLPRQAPLPPLSTTTDPSASASATLSHLPLLLRNSLPSDMLDALANYDTTDARGTVRAVGEWEDEWPISPPTRGGGGGVFDGGGGEGGVELPGPGTGSPTHHRSDPTLAILIPLLVVLTLLLFLIFILTIVLLRRRRGIELTDDGSGPTNLEREDEVDGEGGLEGVEQRWLMSVDEPTRVGYMRAKVWQTQYPPNSQPTEITLTQFLSIQEKGVSAWSFEPDYESNSSVFVQSRTEITFLADGYGMAPEEGGGSCVQSNLPIPKLNDVYYFECKMFEKPEGTNVSVGLATKPYPSFRLPGLSRYSVGYHSADGFKSHSFPFTSTSYGPPLLEGDVLGVGYRPRSGLIFFTRNGKKLEDAFVGFNKHNVFPTIGADGPCSVHVNLGQAGFVFIEANPQQQQQVTTDGASARSVSPPAYNPVDPYMYAPGVAETILEDAFAAAAAAANQQGSSASPITPSAVAGYPGSSSARPPLPGLSPQQVALVAQFAQQRRLMQQQLQAGGGASASGASSPGYEARTASGDGAGAGGAGAGGLGGLLGWLTGRAQAGSTPESRAEQGQA